MTRFRIRTAEAAEAAALAVLIELSVRTLQAADYSPQQIDGALQGVFGVDSQLIADSSYFVVESDANDLVACGGWSKRKTLFGGDHAAVREGGLLDPEVDAAKIRAFFVHPDWVRQGIGSMLLEHCEREAMAAGFRRFEMGATLTGVKLYQHRGYVEVERLEVPLPNLARLPVVRMTKEIPK